MISAIWNSDDEQFPAEPEKVVHCEMANGVPVRSLMVMFSNTRSEATVAWCQRYDHSVYL